MNTADQIEKLNDLRKSGALSDKEYQEAKEALLKNYKSVNEKMKGVMDGISTDANTWGMILHLSQLCGYLIPLAGLAVPILLWQIKKNESPLIDLHGRIVVNWIITAFILGIVFGLLCFILVGFPLLFVLGVLAVVFPIVGAVKALNGEAWIYPCSIPFFRVERGGMDIRK
jgi:hypothetical protein